VVRIWLLNHLQSKKSVRCFLAMANGSIYRLFPFAPAPPFPAPCPFDPLLPFFPFPH
jgi:hypothetical protein